MQQLYARDFHAIKKGTNLMRRHESMRNGHICDKQGEVEGLLSAKSDEEIK